MRLVKLTSGKGRLVFVNPAHVAAVREGFEDPNGAELLLAVPWQSGTAGKDWMVALNVREPAAAVANALAEGAVTTLRGTAAQNLADVREAAR